MLVIYSKDFSLHNDPNNIENAMRLRVIEKAIKQLKPKIKKPSSISKRIIKYIELAHDKEYVYHIREFFHEAYKKNKIIYIDGDTYISPLTWKSAYKSVMGVIRAINLIDKYNKVFVPTRPPGHHAGRFGIANTISQGFCIFNNVAIGALYAKNKEFNKILILDIDLHHGNGTEDIIRNIENIYYISLHSKYIYPGTGMESYDNIYNFPLEPQTTDTEYMKILENKVSKLISSIDPNLILVSLGFDTHMRDPLSTFNVTFRSYKRIFDILRSYRVVYILEGGYNLNVLYRGTRLLIKTNQF
ncbi:MAG TPA: histone deacetylase family protein [Candidatus Nanopusillus sp.]|nr:histone deacetylase family protein [Candidatus Nanopusillus sp.]